MRRVVLPCSRQLWRTNLHIRCRSRYMLGAVRSYSSCSRDDTRTKIRGLLNAPIITPSSSSNGQIGLVLCRTFASSSPSRRNGRSTDPFEELGLPSASDQYREALSKTYVHYDPASLDDFEVPEKTDKAPEEKELPPELQEKMSHFNNMIENGKLPFDRTMPPRTVNSDGDKIYFIARGRETQMLQDNLMDTFKINGSALRTLVPDLTQDHTPPNRFKDMLLTPGLGFFDRTQYLVQMAKGGYEIELSYFRPEGFGKSIVCDMLHFFHGKEYRDYHKFIFQGLAVHDRMYTGQNQNLIPGRFYVLRLNFSPLRKARLFREIAKSASYKPTRQDFIGLSELTRGIIRDAVQDYLNKYPDLKFHGATLRPSSAFKGGKKIVQLLEKFVFKKIEKDLHNLYLIIEDYDWLMYAQQLLIKNSKRQAQVLEDEESFQPTIGGLKDFWLSITHFQKIKRPSLRVVLMGTAPWETIGLNSVRIASQRTYDRSMSPQQACLAGLRVEELELPLTSILRQLYPTLQGEELRLKVLKHVEWMKRLYGNYRFSDVGTTVRTLNSGACVQYMQKLLDKGATNNSRHIQAVERVLFQWKAAVTAVQGRPRPSKPNYNELIEAIRGPDNPHLARFHIPYIRENLKGWTPTSHYATESYRNLVDHFYFWENPNVKQRQEDDSFLYYHGLLAIDPASLSRLLIPNHTALRTFQQIFAHSEDLLLSNIGSKSHIKRIQPAVAQLYGTEGGSERSFWEIADSRSEDFEGLIHSFLKAHKCHVLATENLSKVRDLFWKYLLAKDADHLIERNPDIADMEAEGLLTPRNEPYCVVYGQAVKNTKPHAHVFYFYKPPTSIEKLDDLRKEVDAIVGEEENLENLAKVVYDKLKAYGTPLDCSVMLHPVMLLDYAKLKLEATKIELDLEEKDGLEETLEDGDGAGVTKKAKGEVDAETLRIRKIRGDEGMMAWTKRFRGYPAPKNKTRGKMSYEMSNANPLMPLRRYLDNFNKFFNVSELQLEGQSTAEQESSLKHKKDKEIRAQGRDIKGTVGALSSVVKKRIFARMEKQEGGNDKKHQSRGLLDAAIQEVESRNDSSRSHQLLESEDGSTARNMHISRRNNDDYEGDNCVNNYKDDENTHRPRDRRSRESYNDRRSNHHTDELDNAESMESEERDDPFEELNMPTLKYGRKRSKRHPGELNKGKKAFVKRLEKKRNEMLQENPDVDLSEIELSDEDITERWEKRRDKRNRDPWKVERDSGNWKVGRGPGRVRRV